MLAGMAVTSKVAVINECDSRRVDRRRCFYSASSSNQCRAIMGHALSRYHMCRLELQQRPDFDDLTALQEAAYFTQD
jgi:hypothetical protein